jgi:hypothetical protein
MGAQEGNPRRSVPYSTHKTRHVSGLEPNLSRREIVIEAGAETPEKMCKAGHARVCDNVCTTYPVSPIVALNGSGLDLKA